VNAFILKEWSETPRTLAEEMAWDAVMVGRAPGRSIKWKGPTKEPWLSLAVPGPLGPGGVKLESVIRLEDDHKVTTHFWETLSGERSHPKVKTD